MSRMGARTRLMLRERGIVTVDLLFLFEAILAFTIFVYATTFVESDIVLAVKSLVGFSLVIGGLFLTYITVGLKWDATISEGETKVFLESLGMSLLSIWMTNIVVQQYTRVLSVSPIPSSLFAILIGISEEIVFRGLFLSLTLLLTGSALLAVIVSSAMFMVFHGAIYGFQPDSLLIVGAGGVFLGVAFIMANKRLSVTCTAHSIINILSYVVTSMV